jgi:hypothetical protein
MRRTITISLGWALLLPGLVARGASREIWMGPQGRYREQNAERGMTSDEFSTQHSALRVLKVPEDGQAYHLSLCLSDDWQASAREREIAAWFESGNPRLAGLRVQCHYHLYTDGNAIYRVRLRHRIPAVPAVVLQDSTGFVVYASCESPRYKAIPATADELADDMADCLAAHCRARGIPWNETTGTECDRCRPRPRPSPQPPVNVDLTVRPVVPPLDKPLVPLVEKAIGKPVPEPFPWALLVALCLAGGLVTGLGTWGICFRRQVKAAE